MIFMSEMQGSLPNQSTLPFSLIVASADDLFT